jgi:hypothetical protein
VGRYGIAHLSLVPTVDVHHNAERDLSTTDMSKSAAGVAHPG